MSCTRRSPALRRRRMAPSPVPPPSGRASRAAGDRRDPWRGPTPDPGRRHGALPSHLARRHRAGAADRSRRPRRESAPRRVEENRAKLETLDPEAAARLQPDRHGADQSRARGHPVDRPNAWPNGRSERDGGIAGEVELRPLILLPPRKWLYARCDERFAHMIDEGAVERGRGAARAQAQSRTCR